MDGCIEFVFSVPTHILALDRVVFSPFFTLVALNQKERQPLGTDSHKKQSCRARRGLENEKE